MKFGVGAIFKDEVDYVLEWLAWHRLAGFSRFFIADNNSTDGTRQLLEALEAAGFIDILYIPPQVDAQLLAYQTIVNQYYNQADAIAFIDVDEFIFSDDGVMPTQHLEALFADQNVAAVALNWRIFGSSGKQLHEEGLVIERFIKCGIDSHPRHYRLKSIVRPELISKTHAHYSVILDGYRYANNADENVTFLNAHFEPVSHPMGACQVSPGPLRVNHYATKSFQEFNEKKRNRGDVMLGPDHVQLDSYFVNRDLNDIEFLGPSLFADVVDKEIEAIKSVLRAKTSFYQQGYGAIGKCDAAGVHGWVDIEKGPPTVMVFVNGVLQAKAGAFRYRPDLIKAGVSQNAYSGFRHDFIPALQSGDVVDVSIYGNPFCFESKRTIIG